MKRKIQIDAKEINKVIAEEIEKVTKGDFEKMLGEPEDRKIEYPAMDPANDPGLGDDAPSEFTDGNASTPTEDGNVVDKMKSQPSELLEYLDKLDEAKSVLSRVAAKESDQEVKSKIYSHYEKVQKCAMEMIKDFGITH